MVGDDDDDKVTHPRATRERLRVERARSAGDLDDPSDLIQSADEQPDPFTRIKKQFRFWKWIVGAIAVPAISSTILVGKYLYARGGEDTAARIERAADHRSIEDHERRLREIEAISIEMKFRLERETRRRLQPEPQGTP